jgi:DNA helicase II / ATP-dependent DNA helicase PcrA
MLSELTEAQREAVTHLEGPLLILAGPGSGKTRVVTHRVAWLLQQGIPGHQVLALTFTNKAADEMSRRIEQLTGDPSVWVGTFHRFCARLLRKYAQFVGLQENYTIYDTDDSVRALRQAIGRVKVDFDRFTPETLAKSISWAKNNLISPEEYKSRPGHALGEVVHKVYPAYQRQLTTSNAVDFDDLLFHVATVLRDNPEIRANLDERYRFILVDEYQDTNLAQYAIARALSIDHPNLAVTGDPDQSIYGWRGANLNNILEFERDFPEVHVVRLERNYRSTQRILRVAADLIAHNVRRKIKGLFTENGPGARVRLITYATQKDEAEGIAARIARDIQNGRRRARDFAIFYRINALSRSFEFALRDLGIPYQMVNGLEFFRRKEIKDILAYLHLLNNPQDAVAFLRVVNSPPRGIGKTTLDRLSDFAAKHGLSHLDAARYANRSQRKGTEEVGGTKLSIMDNASRQPPPSPLLREQLLHSIGPRPAKMLNQFVQLFDRLAAAVGGPVEEILGLVLSETGYQKQLRESEDEDDQQRLANIEELLTVARDFDEHRGEAAQLEAFLEETCLVNDTDAWETEVDRVTLMTLHSSKGLEFPVVYLTAVEEGLLPHERSREHPDQLEEERRLMFVGITRARQELQISLSQYRDFRGQRKTSIPSSFLMELPRAEMEVESAYMTNRSVETWPDHQDWSEPVYEDADIHEPSVEEFSPFQLGEGPGVRAARVLPLTTAAAMANGGKPLAALSPDAFRQGMWVLHPSYGLGQIAALSGSGVHRKATVDFRPPTGRKKFLLAEAPLQPVESTNRES